MIEDIAKLVSTMGFPIAVAVYCLVRIERVLTELRDELWERPCLVRPTREIDRR